MLAMQREERSESAHPVSQVSQNRNASSAPTSIDALISQCHRSMKDFNQAYSALQTSPFMRALPWDTSQASESMNMARAMERRRVHLVEWRAEKEKAAQERIQLLKNRVKDCDAATLEMLGKELESEERKLRNMEEICDELLNPGLASVREFTKKVMAEKQLEEETNRASGDLQTREGESTSLKPPVAENPDK